MGRLYDALYDHQDSICTVLVRREQLASVMAEVYGRLTDKPGVVIDQGIFTLAARHARGAAARPCCS
jgi:acetolactate synthase I/II/III large subunit